MDNITKKSCVCGCQVFVNFGGRVEPDDVYVYVEDPSQVPVDDEEEDDELQFPQVVTDLGIDDRIHNSGCVEFDFTICTGCRRIQ